MAVKACDICNRDTAVGRQYGDQGLAEGQVCPICYQAACRYHLGTVRWRWRQTGQLDSALVCQECLRSYRHRDWDTYHREWIT